MLRQSLCLFLCLVLSAPAVFSQDTIDALKIKYNNARTDRERQAVIYWFATTPNLNDSATIHRAFLLLSNIQKQGDSLNAALMKLGIVSKLYSLGDYNS